MPKDNQKKADITPKSDKVKEDSPAAKEKAPEKAPVKESVKESVKEEVKKPASLKGSNEAEKTDGQKIKNESNPSGIKDSAAMTKKSENKKDKISKTQSEKKSSKMMLLWPVFCSALTAGGLIATQDMWMKTTSLTSSEHVNIHKNEITILKEQVELLNKQSYKQDIEHHKSEIAVLKEQVNSLNEQWLAFSSLKEDMAIEASEATESRLEPKAVTEENQAEAYTPKENANEENKANALTTEETAEAEIVKEQIATEEKTNMSPLPMEAMIAEAMVKFQGENADSVAYLEAQITSLEQSIHQLQDEQMQKDEYDMNMVSRVDMVETQLLEIEADMAQLKADILEISTSPKAELASQYMALDNLASRIQTGENYKDALDALDAVMEPSQAIDNLRPYETGVLPLHRLITEFKPIGRDIIVTERKALAEEAGSSQKILSSFNELVTISRKDGGKEGSADRLVYDIEQALKNGDFRTVIDLLESRNAETQAAAKSWLDKVKIRDEISQNILQLRDDLANQSKGE